MQFEIAAMRPEDMDAKAYVHWKAWQETYAGLVDAAYLEQLTLEKCRAIARRWPDDVLVAKEGGRVVGFAGYGECRDADLPDAGELFSLYVLREAQRRGIGCALTARAIGLLPQFQKIAVWVLRGNERAIGFYRHCGFEPDGAAKTIALGAPATALRMVLRRDVVDI